MTPKKEIFLAIRDRLKTVAGIEYIDLNRNQFSASKENYPSYFTSCLIKITSIQWQTMVEQKQEGTATVEVTLFTLDGFADQHADTADNEDGLAEIELIDNILDAIQFLYGDSFNSLQQTNEESEETELVGLMAYKLTFTTLVYRKSAERYIKAPNPLKAI